MINIGIVVANQRDFEEHMQRTSYIINHVKFWPILNANSLNGMEFQIIHLSEWAQRKHVCVELYKHAQSRVR